MKKLCGLVLCAALLFTLSTNAAALVLTGPSLKGPVGGWDDSGLSITALQDVTLESFVYVSRAAEDPDTIWLTDNDGTILYTHSYPGNGNYDPLINYYYTAYVSWSLAAGETYHLVKDDPDHGCYASIYEGDYFPFGNEHIQVNGTYDGEYSMLNTTYWFYFTDITTIDNTAVPEPATILLLGFGFMGLAGAWRKLQG